MKTTQQSNSISKKQFIIGLLAVLAVGIVGAGVLVSAATEDSVYITTELGGGTYTAGSGDKLTIERWKYTIRDDNTCDGSVFVNNGKDAGNLTDIVYGSNSYTPANANEVGQFNDKYICFDGLDESGTWHHVGRQLVWSPGYVEQNYDPVEDEEEGGGSGAEDECPQGQVVKAGQCFDPCEPDHVLVESDCVLDIDNFDIDNESGDDESGIDWTDDTATEKFNERAKGLVAILGHETGSDGHRTVFITATTTDRLRLLELADYFLTNRASSIAFSYHLEYGLDPFDTFVAYYDEPEVDERLLSDYSDQNVLLRASFPENN